ncbi:unnamed protein product, partial [Porites evermanni]
MATIRLINSFYQPVKSSEIENETVNSKEMKLKPWNVKTVTFELSDFNAEGEGSVSSCVIEG